MNGKSRIASIITLWALFLSGGTAPAVMLSGRVYEGPTGVEPPSAKPLVGVTVKLCVSNSAGVHGTEIRSTVTDAQGWYGL